MPSSASGARDHDGGRIGGARADFVASLGRKVNDARELLAVLEEDPSSKAAREELRRRLHALGAGARLLRLEAMTLSLQQALGVLDRGAAVGVMAEQDVGFVAQVLEDLPTLAWGELPSRAPAAAPGEATADGPGPLPIAVLVVGGEGLAAAFAGADRASPRARSFECERTEDVDSALELARTCGPDVLLVDVDLARASGVVEAVLDDPLTNAVPVVVVGTFSSPEEPARFVALGAARTMAKPVPPELVRSACDEVVATRDEPTVRVTLGEPTLEQLAERLADELKRALVDGVGPARTQRVPLGEGTEVLGALWGAIARVQEIVAEKTGGTIRFAAEAPEGAIALAPSLHQDLPAADRLAGRGRGASTDVRLHGRRVVVADDDPGVTWFISDLLRTAGCEVYEALDGSSALQVAFRVQPELVVSDILMPGLDGFALCRALRRDVALRDTPVILLSWKEDLLQRVRELGASAAAYMRKESGSRTILARVREVLRPRARLEMRLRAEGEVRGRLDGVTPRVLLELACLIRPDARVSVRDATYLYEIELRGGAPRRATRTASDGSHRSGERALASLLGVGAGRFAVTPSNEPLRGELTGKLVEQLVRPIAAARAALAATTGARTMSVERISFDEEAIEDYLLATPEPTRSLIRRLSQGAAPRELLLGGEVSPSLVEDVLADLAARGAVLGVQGARGVDLLQPALEAALAALEAAPRPRTPPPPSAWPSASARPAAASSPSPSSWLPSPLPSPSSARPSASASEAPARYEALVVSEPPPPPAAVDDDAAPSSLEDAVMRELSDRSAVGRSSAPASEPPPIIKPSELLVRRASDPAIDDSLIDAQVAIPSIPPDAVVPAATGAGDEPNAPLSGHESPRRSPAAPVSAEPATVSATPAPVADASPAAPEARGEAGAIPAAPEPAAPEPAEAAPSGPSAPAARPRARRGRLFALGALASAAAALLGKLASDDHSPEQPGASGGAAPAARPASPEPLSPAPASSPAPATPPAPPPSTPQPPGGSDLPPGAEVPPGFGLLDVQAPGGSPVLVDGKYAGVGPSLSVPATPGYHEVRVRQGNRESTQVIEVRTGKTTHVRSALLP